jgi:hypothetical protein
LSVITSGIAAGQNNNNMENRVPHNGPAFAIFAEYARERNILMKNGLNRRVFNVTEAIHGADIRLEADGSVLVLPGVYRITGFSMVTMQAKMAPPVMLNNTNYPGYCLLYPREHEADNPLGNNIAIGSPATAFDTCPSLFDFVFACERPTYICVGHQSGEHLNDEVYLSVYDVDGIPSEYHVFARIAINRM